MQNGRSLSTIEQKGDAGCTMAYGDNDANPVGQLGATNFSEFAELETRADRNPIYSQIHGCASQRDRSHEQVVANFVRSTAGCADHCFRTVLRDLRSAAEVKVLEMT
jgi:hypothetical protein